MEFDELRAFVAIASFSSVTHAADAMHISQPALSKKLHKLEDLVGATLFIRRGPTLELTPAGCVLLDHAVHLTKGYEQAVKAARDIAAHTSNLRRDRRVRISQPR